VESDPLTYSVLYIHKSVCNANFLDFQMLYLNNYVYLRFPDDPLLYQTRFFFKFEVVHRARENAVSISEPANAGIP
jgi:hypothetical protein